MEDKRWQGRWTISDKVLYKKTGEELERECVSKDISAYGARLSCSEAIAPNAEIDLKINIGKKFAPISAKGKVIWVKSAKECAGSEFFAGVRLSSLTYADKDKIFDYAFNNRREEVIRRWWQEA